MIETSPTPSDADADAAADASPQPALGGPRLVVGIVVSVVAVAAVVWWALSQPAPKLPDEGADWAAVVGALTLYAIGTCLRAERWRELVRDQGGDMPRADLYALTVVGFAGNNMLPARGGDAFRILLGAPRAGLGRRTMIGTLLAERLLDIAVLASLFAVLAVTIAGGNVPKGDALVVVLSIVAGLAVLAGAGWVVAHRRGLLDRIREFVKPMLASTIALRGRHGAAMLGISAAIWFLEGLVWTLCAAAADVGIGVLDGFYVLALSSMFALIPSGPGYAGTVDAATILGTKAVGGSSQAAVSFLILVRFIVFVPITVVGLIVGTARYGGLRRLRAA